MEARFLTKVNKTDTCWLWTGYKTSKGYGQFGVNYCIVRAHRVAYELWVGPIPSGLILRHKCDNPSCVNPDHLETGTHQDNANDRVERGRSAKGDKSGARLHPEKMPRGENHHNSKLTYDDVVEIKVLLGFGVTQEQIAEQFGVGDPTISKIKRGILWSHVIPASAPSRLPQQ